MLDGLDIEAEPALATAGLDHGAPGGLVQARGALDLSLKRVIDPTDCTVIVSGASGNPKNIRAPGPQPSQQHLRHPVRDNSKV